MAAAMPLVQLNARPAVHQERDDRADQEHNKQDLGNARGAGSNAAKTEDSRDQSNDQENDGIMKHVSSFFIDFDRHLRPTPFSHAETIRVPIGEVKELGPCMSVGFCLLELNAQSRCDGSGSFQMRVKHG